MICRLMHAACLAITVVGVASCAGERLFQATVVEIIPEEQGRPVAGVEVTLVSNDDGHPLGPVVTSDESGAVSFYLKRWARAGFRMARPGYLTTYRFDVKPDAEGVRLQLMPLKLWAETIDTLGLTESPDTGFVAGQVLVGELEVKGAKVGCARVESEDGGTSYYFEPRTRLMAPLSQASQTSWDVSDFLVAGIPAGVHRLRVVVDGNVVGSRKVPVIAGALTFDAVVSTDRAENPTPQECRVLFSEPPPPAATH